MQNPANGSTPTNATPVGGYDVHTGASSPKHRWRWLWALLVAFGLWVVCMFVTQLTGNTNLIPADILLGSFMVPVAAVIWNFDHRADSNLPLTRIFMAFVVGGTLGILMAAIVESIFGWIPEPLQNVPVGLIEEAAKLTALFVVAQRLRRYTTIDGLVLGSTVGFGFAALESSGYAFNGLLTQQGLSISSMAIVVVERGMLAPLGHGLWTAVLGMYLFNGSEQSGRLRITKQLVVMYFVIAGIHATWDFLDWVAGVLGGPDVLSIFLNLITGAGGLLVLWLSWYRLVRLPRLYGGQRPPGFQPAAATGAPWQPPAAPWSPQQPGYSGWPTAGAGYGAPQPPPQQPQPPAQAPPAAWQQPQQPPPGYAPPPPQYSPSPPLPGGNSYGQPPPPPQRPG